MLFLLGNKSKLGVELVKRTLIHRTVATAGVKLSGRPVKSFTQRDFDKVHRRKVNDLKKKIEEKSANMSEDPFSPVKYFIKALTIGFTLATVCSISYGEASLLLDLNKTYFQN